MLSRLRHELKCGTALKVIWENNAHPRTPPILDLPPPVPETPGDESDHIPKSLEMLAAIVQNIINMRYSKNYSANINEIAAHPFVSDNGTYVIGFYPHDIVHMSDEEYLDVYSDPDCFDTVRDFLTDLTEYAGDLDVDILVSKQGFMASDMMTMYRLVSRYMTSKEHAISTPDTIFIAKSTFDPEIEEQQRKYYSRIHANEVRMQIVQHPEIMDGLLLNVNNGPYSSMDEFMAACYLADKVEINMPLSHLFATICHEEGIPTDVESPGTPLGMKLTYGGYH